MQNDPLMQDVARHEECFIGRCLDARAARQVNCDSVRSHRMFHERQIDHGIGVAAVRGAGVEVVDVEGGGRDVSLFQVQYKEFQGWLLEQIFRTVTGAMKTAVCRAPCRDVVLRAEKLGRVRVAIGAVVCFCDAQLAHLND